MITLRQQNGYGTKHWDCRKDRMGTVWLMIAPKADQVKSKSTESCCGRMIQTMNPRKMTASGELHIWQKSTPKAMHRKGSGSCFRQEFQKNNRLIQQIKVQYTEWGKIGSINFRFVVFPLPLLRLKRKYSLGNRTIQNGSFKTLYREMRYYILCKFRS